jgi:hypothetical protein
MALARSESGRETNETDHDENDGPGVPKFEEASAHFRQQKENANGNNHYRSHEAADAAALAGTTSAIAHLCVTSRGSLLRPAVDAVSKHQNPNPNQNEGPKPGYAPPLKPFKIVEQEQDSNANQDDRTNGALFAEIIEWV